MNQHIWIQKNFSKFFSKKYTNDMSIKSVFDGNYESAIILSSIQCKFFLNSTF
jgi:hypothetical protein